MLEAVGITPETVPFAPGRKSKSEADQEQVGFGA